MPNLKEAFPSKYLSAGDLNGRRVTVEIESAGFETINNERKLIVFFVGKDKGLVLNKTNAMMISSLLGADDTDDWIGRRIILRPDMTTFQGKPVQCVRVDSELPPQPAKVKAAVANNEIEDIPF
jgi:hypothetical protein